MSECQEVTHLDRVESACEVDELVDKMIGTERGVSYTLTASLGLTDNIIRVHTPSLGVGAYVMEDPRS